MDENRTGRLWALASGISEDLAGERETWLLSAVGAGEDRLPALEGWGVCLFLPRKGKEKRISLNIQLYKQCHEDCLRSQREARC